MDTVLIFVLLVLFGVSFLPALTISAILGFISPMVLNGSISFSIHRDIRLYMFTSDQIEIANKVIEKMSINQVNNIKNAAISGVLPTCRNLIQMAPQIADMIRTYCI